MKFALVRVKLLIAVLLNFVLSGFHIAQADAVEEAGTSNDLSSCRSCGLVNIKKEIRTSIVGGEIVQPPYKYPWMVVIQIQGENQCTAFIINEYYIMTAAHCATIEKPSLGDNETLEFLKPNEITVAFLTQTEEVEPGPSIQEIIPYPEFSVTRLRHDIVLLKLSNRLTCSQFRNPICLPSADLTVHKGEQFTISGWGSEESGGIELSKKLKEAKVENINMNEEVCIKSNAFIRQEDRKDHFYCVKGLKGETGCTGDSGGPMFSERSGKYYAVGVFAAATGDCATNSGSFYTSVSKHIPWIQDVMGSSFPGATSRAENCTEPMGFENRQLPESLISVSSSMNASTGPSRIRLNTHNEGNLTGGWIASYPQDHKPKVCIDFSEKRNLTGIMTQGLVDDDFWAVSYKVRYSLDNETWDDIREKKTGDLVFRGNVDRNTPVQRLFNGMITARFLEVVILDYHNLPALRMEILGCFIPYKYGAPFQDIALEFLKPSEITVAFFTQTGEVEPGPPIEEIIPHPGFSFKDFKRDISLLKLSSRLTCNQFRNPICLPSANLTVDMGKQFTITGWGEDENQELSKQLKEAKVEYRNISECRPYVSYRMVEYMKDHFHCIKGLMHQSACLGDSGGPAFDEILGKYYAFSVGSLTHNNCTLGAPFLHTSVFKHIDWIKEVMGSSFPGTIEQPGHKTRKCMKCILRLYCSF